MSIQSFILILLGGGVTGIFGALLGIGGGVFLIPFLVLILKIPIHEAVATGIIAVIATSSAAASVNVERRFTNIRLGMVLEVATTIGAILGGVTANIISGQALSKIFGVVLFIVAVLMLRRTREKTGDIVPIVSKKKITGIYFDPAINQEVKYSVQRLPLGLGVSFIAGNISGLLGIGGGVIKVPAMNLFCGIPLKAATATSNFMIGVTAAASAFIYYAHDRINPIVTAAAVLGILLGSVVGTQLSARLHSRIIAGLFTIVMFFLAIEMFTG